MNRGGFSPDTESRIHDRGHRGALVPGVERAPRRAPERLLRAPFWASRQRPNHLARLVTADVTPDRRGTRKKGHGVVRGPYLKRECTGIAAETESYRWPHCAQQWEALRQVLLAAVGNGVTPPSEGRGRPLRQSGQAENPITNAS